MARKKNDGEGRGKQRKVGTSDRSSTRVYQMEVSLVEGPITEEFIEENPSVCRTIEILGSQTLEELHSAIFDAFDRLDEHMYEFQVGGKEPMDRKARHYVLEAATSGPFPAEKPAGLVEDTTIASLGLKVDDRIFYWFDFGDDWWHEIDVKSVRDEADDDEYPRVTGRVGESPPQYFEDEEDEEEEGDEEA